MGYAQQAQEKAALSLLDSISGQIETDEGQARLVLLRSQVKELAQLMRVDERLGQEGQQQTARLQHIAELKQRLAQARQDDRQEEVARYERLLSNLGQ